MRYGADEILVLQGSGAAAAVAVSINVVVAIVIQISRALHQDHVVRSSCYGAETPRPAIATRKK
jgi:hypothetical protein